MLEVVRIPVLSDNYVWLLHDDASGETVLGLTGRGASGAEPEAA